MAKDRFSRFKRSNYDNDFRWGTNEYGTAKHTNRDVLSDKQKDWIINVIQNRKINEWETKFLRSILVDGKLPTQKQKDIIKRIIKKK
jgi:hypothetical protein